MSPAIKKRPFDKDYDMPRHGPDTDFPCPSAYPWGTNRADSGAADQLNIVCEAAGVVIAVNVPAKEALDIVTAHNGE